MFSWLSNTPGKHHPVVEYAVKRFVGKGEGKLSIDLGCGYGNEVIFLLEQGFHVCAVDSDIQALSVVHNKAKNLGLERRLCLVFGEIPYVLYSKILDWRYDVILCINLLHHMYPTEVKIVLNWMRNHTKHQGIHIIVSFLEGSGYHFKTLFKPGELCDIYKHWGWNILLDSYGYLPKHKDSMHPEEELEHYYEVIVARKPLF